MKQVIVVGGIGNTDRQNRDGCRVFGGGGAVASLKAHQSGDKPLVLRKYERTDSSWKNESQDRSLL